MMHACILSQTNKYISTFELSCQYLLHSPLNCLELNKTNRRSSAIISCSVREFLGLAGAETATFTAASSVFEFHDPNIPACPGTGATAVNKNHKRQETLIVAMVISLLLQKVLSKYLLLLLLLKFYEYLADIFYRYFRMPIKDKDNFMTVRINLLIY